MVKALLDQGAIEGELLRQAVTDQSVDAVFDLLRWQQGDFAFVVDEVNPDDVGVTLSIEAILADAESRTGSWESVSQIVPSADALLSMPVVLPADPQISREEWSLLALVDGRRSVAELVDLTGSGHYAVVSTLAGLVARGLLEVRDAADATEDHVGVVVRRQGCSPRWRAQPFQPVRSSAVEAEPPSSGRSRGTRGGRAADEARGRRRRSPDGADATRAADRTPPSTPSRTPRTRPTTTTAPDGDPGS